MTDNQEVRIECLKLAITTINRRQMNDVDSTLEVAGQYLEFVSKGEPVKRKPGRPRKIPEQAN